MSDSLIGKTLDVTFKSPGGAQASQAITFQQGESVLGSSEGIGDFGKAQYRPAGACIYCGATEGLTDEHIIPYGLNGTTELPAASCRRCATETGRCEAYVLRGPMRAVRVLRRLKSRSKHAGAPGTQTLVVVRGGVEERIPVPIEQYPTLLFFPRFAMPRVLTGLEGTGIDLTGVDVVGFGPAPEEVLRRLGGERLRLGEDPQTYRYVPFARMVAKIAYGFAFAEGALHRLEGACPALPAIRGDTDTIGDWVGTFTGPNVKYPNLLHRVAIREDPGNGVLLGEVQLFADSAAPTYGVILGRLRSAALEP